MDVVEIGAAIVGAQCFCSSPFNHIPHTTDPKYSSWPDFIVEGMADAELAAIRAARLKELQQQQQQQQKQTAQVYYRPCSLLTP